MSRQIVAIASISLVLLVSFGTLEVVRRLGRKSRVAATRPAEERSAPTFVPEAAARPSAREYVGVVIARESVEVTAKFEGRLSNVDVRLGDRVKDGQPLASIDVSALRKDLALAEASARAARADEQKALIELQGAREQFARASSLKQMISAEELAAAKYQASLADASLQSAQAHVAEREAALGQLRHSIADAVIRAPFDGSIAARFVDPGTIVGPGKPIVRIIRDDDFVARFAVPENEAKSIKLGANVTATVDSLALVLPGVVERLAPEVDSGSRMLAAEARLTVPEEWKPRLPSGLVARISGVEPGLP